MRHYKGVSNYKSELVRFLDTEGLTGKEAFPQRSEKVRQLPRIFTLLSDVIVYVVEGSIFSNKQLLLGLKQFVEESQKNLETILFPSLVVAQNGAPMEECILPIEASTKRFMELPESKEISKKYKNVFCVNFPKIDVGVHKLQLLLERLEETKYKIEQCFEEASEFKKNRDIITRRKSW